MVKVILCHKDLLLKERICTPGSNLFPLREVPILKRDAIEKNLDLFFFPC